MARKKIVLQQPMEVSASGSSTFTQSDQFVIDVGVFIQLVFVVDILKISGTSPTLTVKLQSTAATDPTPYQPAGAGGLWHDLAPTSGTLSAAGSYAFAITAIVGQKVRCNRPTDRISG
jgi:hypothetical protein